MKHTFLVPSKHCTLLDSCRESNARALIEQTRLCTAAYMLIKEYVVTDRKGCLVKEHLVRERPKPAEPTVIPPLYLNYTTKEPAFTQCTVLDLHW